MSGTIPIKTGDTAKGYLYEGEWAHYKFEPGPGQYDYHRLFDAIIQADLYDLSGDLDLYMNIGSVPTEENYTCRPYKGSATNERCHTTNTGEEKTLYISVHGYRAGSYKLQIYGKKFLPKHTALNPALLSGDLKGGGVNKGEWNHYKIETRRLDKEILIRLYNFSDDTDLYVRRGRAPLLNTFDCRPYFGGSATEECKLENEDGAVTTWYISVHGYHGGHYTLSLEGQ
jgi:hypothetical protein